MRRRISESSYVECRRNLNLFPDQNLDQNYSELCGQRSTVALARPARSRFRVMNVDTAAILLSIFCCESYINFTIVDIM